jgi:hypothetical protein
VKPEAVGWSNALLNDLEEDKAARSVVFGLLAEMSGFYVPWGQLVSIAPRSGV